MAYSLSGTLPDGSSPTAPVTGAKTVGGGSSPATVSGTVAAAAPANYVFSYSADDASGAVGTSPQAQVTVLPPLTLADGSAEFPSVVSASYDLDDGMGVPATAAGPLTWSEDVAGEAQTLLSINMRIVAAYVDPATGIAHPASVVGPPSRVQSRTVYAFRMVATDAPSGGAAPIAAQRAEATLTLTIDPAPAGAFSVQPGAQAVYAHVGDNVASKAPTAQLEIDPVAYALAPGSAPPSWLSVDPKTGILSGKATSPWSGTLVVAGSDSNVPSSTASFPVTLTVTAPMTMAAYAPLTARTGSGIGPSDGLGGWEGVAAPSVANAAGTVTYTLAGQPRWMSVDKGTGTIYGSPSASDVAASPESATLTATDQSGDPVSGVASATVTITVAGPFALTAAGPFELVQGTALAAPVQLSAGPAPYTPLTFSVYNPNATYGAGIPKGLQLSQSGLLSGTPTLGGAPDPLTGKPTTLTNTVTVVVTDGEGFIANATLRFDVLGPSAPSTVQAVPGGGETWAGNPSYQVVATQTLDPSIAFPADAVWSAPTTGALMDGLPKGLTVVPTGRSAVVQGNVDAATAPGTYNVPISLSSVSGAFTETAVWTLRIDAPLVAAATPATVRVATPTPASTAGVTASQGKPPYAATVSMRSVASSTPSPISGLSVDVQDAQATVGGQVAGLSGTPTQAGSFAYAVTVNDSIGSPAVTVTESVTVLPPLAVCAAGSAEAVPAVTGTPASPASCLGFAAQAVAVGRPITTVVPVVLSHPQGTPAWTVSGLPAGLSFDPATGTVSGTMAAADAAGPLGPVYATVVTVSDATGGTASATLALTALPPLPLAMEPIPATVVRVGMAMTPIVPTLDTPPSGPATYAVTGLPADLKWDPATGTISGKPGAADAAGPTTASTYTVSLSAVDSYGGSSSRAFTLTVLPVLLALGTQPVPEAVGVKAAVTAPTLANSPNGTTPAPTTPGVAWSVSSGSLPAGVLLSPATGALSGAPLAQGAYAATLQAVDAQGATATITYAFTVGAAPYLVAGAPALETYEGAPLTAFLLGGAAANAAAASPGIPADATWSAAGLPATLPVDPSQTHNGFAEALATGVAPAASGSPYAVVLTLSDANASESGTATLTVDTAISVAQNVGATAAAAPGAPLRVGVANATAAATISGGRPNAKAPLYATSVSATSVDGLAVAADGSTAGKPTAAGTFTFNLTVADALPQTVVATQTLTVLPALAFAAVPPQTVRVGIATGPVATSVGPSPVAGGSYTASGLPDGITFDASGKLSGLPKADSVTSATAPSGYSATLSFVDADGAAATGTAAYTVEPPLLLSYAASPAGARVGAAYALPAPSVLNAPVGAVTWTVTGVPAPLVASATGAITGIPGATGSFPVTVVATDSQGATASTSFTLQVRAPLTASVTAPTTYVGAVALSGGPLLPGPTLAGNPVTPVTWTLTSGTATLPPGLTFNAADGSFSGTPTMAGVFSVTMNVIDGQGGTLATPVSYSVTVLPALQLTGITSQVGRLSIAKTYVAPGVFGNPQTPLTWTWTGTATDANGVVTASTTPPGLSISAAVGTILGTPTAQAGAAYPVTYATTISVVDATGRGVSAAETFTIEPGLTIASAPNVVARAGQKFAMAPLAVAGVPVPTVGWYLTSTPGLPTGVSYNSSTGVISGTPSANLLGSTYSEILKIIDNDGASATSPTFTLTVAPPLAIANVADKTFRIGGTVTDTAPSVTPTGANGPAAPVAWTSLPAALPAGFLLSATGALTASPSPAGPAGSTSTTLTLTDADGGSATSNTFALNVLPATAVGTLAAATLHQGTAYSYPVPNVANATNPVTLAAVAPAVLPATATSGLPTTMTATPAAGSTAPTVSGTPTAAGTFTFALTLSDAYGGQAKSGDTTFTVIPPLAMAAASGQTGYVGQQASYLAPAVDQTTVAGTLAWTASGTLPPGMSLNAATGAVTGSPTTLGTYPITLTATDSNLGTASQAYTISIVRPVLTAASTQVGVGTALASTPLASLMALANAPVGTTTWSYTGTLQTGLSINASSGVLSGTPTTSGVVTIQVVATDTVSGASAPATLTVTVSGTADQSYPTSVVPSGGSDVTAALYDGSTATTATVYANGSRVVDYYFASATSVSNVEPIGGAGAITYTLYNCDSGCTALPYSSNTGGEVLSAPSIGKHFQLAIGWTYYGTSPVAITVPSGLRLGYNGKYPVYVPSLTAGTVNVTQGTAASTQISTALAPVNVTGTPIWSVVSGTLPANVSLSSSGVLSGTPTAVGTSIVQVALTDASGVASVPVALTVAVQSPISAGNTFPSSVAGGGVGYMSPQGPAGLPALTDFFVTGQNFTGIDVTAWAYNSVAGTTLTASCVLGGGCYPPETVRYAQAVQVDSIDMTQGTSAVLYACTANCSGGSPTFGPALATTKVNGYWVLAQPVSSTMFLVGASGTSNLTTSRVRLGLGGSFPGYAPSTTAGSLTVMQGTTYAGTTASARTAMAPVASSAAADEKWAVFSGTMPAGLTLNANGTLTGTATVNGTFPLVLTVSDATGITSIPKTLTLTVLSSVLASNTLPTGVTNGASTPVPAPASFTPYRTAKAWTVSTGTATMSAGSSYPDLTGWAYDASLTTTTGSGTATTATFAQPVTADSFDLGAAVSGAVTVYWCVGTCDGSATVSYGSATATNTSGGIYKIPQAASSNVFVIVTSNANALASVRLGYQSTFPNTATLAASTVTAPANAAYSSDLRTVMAASGTTIAGTVTWTVVSGALPTNLSISGSTLSGTPTTTGTYTATLVATEASGVTSAPAVLTVQVTSSTNSGLAAYWKFDEGSGTTAADASGNGHALTFTAAGWTTSGIVKSAAVFSGTNSASAAWGLLTGAAARTINLWFNTSTTTDSDWISWGANSQNALSQVGIYQGQIGLLPYGTGIGPTITTSNWANGAWHMLTVTYDGTTAIVYIDGVQQASGAIALATGTSAIVFGKAITGSYAYTGQMDETGIWTRALSATEVTSLYNGGLGGQPTVTAVQPTIAAATVSVAHATAQTVTLSTTMALTNGAEPLWSVSSGTLPGTLTLNAKTGVISGNSATTAGTTTVSITVTNFGGLTSTAVLTLKAT